MTDPRDLKIALLRAQRDRMLRYDPEWGPAPEDRPLARLVRVEWYAHASPAERARYDATIARSLFMLTESNRMMAALSAQHAGKFDGGKRIIVPLTYATHDREITS